MCFLLFVGVKQAGLLVSNWILRSCQHTETHQQANHSTIILKGTSSKNENLPEDMEKCALYYKEKSTSIA